MNQFACKLCALLLVIALRPLPAQVVWPGDANNNGIANAVDALYIGVAHDSDGPDRDDASTDWEAQPFELWGTSFPDGTDYGYADTDGGGEIEDDDISGVLENFGLTHGLQSPDGYANAAPGGNAPTLSLQPSATLVEPGMPVEISLSLGEAAAPLTNFYGIAFRFSYNEELLEDGSSSLQYDDLENTWLNADEAEVEELFYNDDLTGRAELALTRLNQTTISGSGEIAAFSIIIEDIIVGLTVDTFELSIDSVLLIDNNFKRVPVVPDTARIIVAKDTNLVNTGTTQAARQLEARVYPNPARTYCYLKTPAALSELRLIDAYGRLVWTAPPELLLPVGDARRIPLHHLPPGTYQLQGRSPNGQLYQKVVVH